MYNARASSRFSRIALLSMATASLIAAAGCAAPGTSGIGSGKYLQLLEGDAVVVEMETAISGMASCTETAHSWIRNDPSLGGRIQCAASSANTPLDYSVLLRSTLGLSDGYRPAAPYRIRTSTSARCRAILNAAKGDSGRAIVEDKCGS